MSAQYFCTRCQHQFSAAGAVTKCLQKVLLPNVSTICQDLVSVPGVRTKWKSQMLIQHQFYVNTRGKHQMSVSGVNTYFQSEVSAPNFSSRWQNQMSALGLQELALNVIYRCTVGTKCQHNFLSQVSALNSDSGVSSTRVQS
jgi:hypothetical protein